MHKFGLVQPLLQPVLAPHIVRLDELKRARQARHLALELANVRLQRGVALVRVDELRVERRNLV
jgi:hypothetical protein